MNHVYTLSVYKNVIGAGGLGDITWEMQIPNRTALLKSLHWTLQLTETVSGQNRPLETNIMVPYGLLCSGIIPGTKIAQDFQKLVLGGASLGYSAENVYSYKPEQIRFNSFFIRNGLRFGFYLTNKEPAIIITYNFSIHVEIEII